jgi:hypothetical protein
MFENSAAKDKETPLDEGAVIVIILASVDAKKVVWQPRENFGPLSNKYSYGETDNDADELKPIHPGLH